MVTIMMQKFEDVREDVASSVRTLYKDKCVEKLADQTRLYDKNNIETNDKKFTLWLKNNIYEKLIDIKLAETFIKFVLCSKKFLIIFMPTLKNSEGSEKQISLADYGMEGVTFANYEQIFISAKKTDDEWDDLYKNYFLSLIVHELAHFAIYETFCNEYNPFLSNDKKSLEKWLGILDNILQAQLKIDVFENAFDQYQSTEVTSEIVVRYFQCLILFCNNKEQLKRFEEEFADLMKASKEVLDILETEYDKICAVRENNQLVFNIEKSPYQKTVIESGKLQKISNETKIVQTSNTALAANFIFYEFEKNEKYFQSKFVFFNAKNLKDNHEKLTQFKLAAERRVQVTFVINCEQLSNLNDINVELNDFIEKLIAKHLVILISENHDFCCNHIKTLLDVRITSDLLTDEFIATINVEIHGDETFITNMLSVEDFKSLKVELPSKPIKIGNQMKRERCKHYVKRRFYVLNEEKSEKYDNIDQILEKKSKILIVNGSGAGKTIESEEMYYRFTDHSSTKERKTWIVHINLSDCFDVLSNVQTDLQSFYSDICKLSAIEMSLFEHMIKKGRVIIIFDSLDEVSPMFYEKITKLVGLMNLVNQNQRIIMFSRPHIAKQLESGDVDFCCVELETMDKNLRRKMMEKYYESKFPEVLTKERNEILSKIEEFLKINNFLTPLLIKMTLGVSRLPSFKVGEMKLSNIYKKFIGEFRTVTTLRNKQIENDLVMTDEIHKYFQKNAICNLISHRVVHRHHINMSENYLKAFEESYFKNVQKPEDSQLQRLGILEIDYKSEYRFIHASFEDFYIAQFIIHKIEKFSYEKEIHIVLELFSILLNEDRLMNVVEFLNSSKGIAEFFNKFKVIYQILEHPQSKDSQNRVNIMPLVYFFVEILSLHSNLRKICTENNFSSAMVLFSDPIEMLEKVFSWKNNLWKSHDDWKSYVYENILMNKTNLKASFFCTQKFHCPVNIVDIFSVCGEESRTLSYLVNCSQLDEYFEKLICNFFDNEHLKVMLSPLIALKPDLDRSFFSAARNSNIFVSKIFLNFFIDYVSTLNTFANPLSGSFLSIFMLNERLCNDKNELNKVEQSIVKIHNLTTENLSNSLPLISHNWLVIMARNLKKCRHFSSYKQFKKALALYKDIVGNAKFLEISERQEFDGERFLFSLLNLDLIEEFKIALLSVLETLRDTDKQKHFLTQHKSFELSLLQKYITKVCFNRNCTYLVFILETYEKIFNDKFKEIIENQLLELNFVNELNFQVSTLNIYDINEHMRSKIVSFFSMIFQQLRSSNSLFKFLAVINPRGETILNSILNIQNDELLHCFLSFCKKVSTQLLSIFISENIHNESFLSKLTDGTDDSKIIKFVLEVFETTDKFDEYYFAAIYELFSNNTLHVKQLFNLLLQVLNIGNLKDDQLDKLFDYRHHRDTSSVLIAAAKCEKEGRIMIFLDLFPNCKSESFKKCLLEADMNGNCALSHLLVNEHQDSDSIFLLERVRLIFEDDSNALRKQISQVMLKSNLSENNNIIFNIMKMNRKGIKSEIISSFLYYLENDEKEMLLQSNEKITSNNKEKSTLITDYLDSFFEISPFLIESLLNGLFDNHKIYAFYHKKLEDLAVEKVKQLVSVNEFESAFHFFSIQNNKMLISKFSEILNSIYQPDYVIFIRQSLLNANFKVFQDAKMITYRSSKWNVTVTNEPELKPFFETFIYLMSCIENWPLLDGIVKLHNSHQRNFKDFFNLICSLTDSDRVKNLMIEKKEIKDATFGKIMKLSPLQISVKYGSVDFLKEFIESLEKSFISNIEFKKYFREELELIYYGKNVFHLLLSKDFVDFIKLRDIFLLIISYFEDPNEVAKTFMLQENSFGDIPLVCGLNRSNVKECFKFFSSIFSDKNFMRDLLRYKNKNQENVLRHILSKSVEHFDFVSEIIDEYFEESQRFHVIVETISEDSTRCNIINVLYQENSSNENSFVEKLSHKLKNSDMVKSLFTNKNEEGETPIFVTSMLRNSKLVVPRFQMLEKIFHDDVKSLMEKILLQNDRYDFSMIYYIFLFGKCEDIKFMVKFYSKFFTPNHVTALITKALHNTEYGGNSLLHLMLTRNSFVESDFYAVCDIVSKHITSSSELEKLFAKQNDNGDTPLMKFVENYNAIDCLKFFVNEYKFPRNTIKKLLQVRNKKKSTLLTIQSNQNQNQYATDWYKLEKDKYYQRLEHEFNLETSTLRLFMETYRNMLCSLLILLISFLLYHYM